AGIQTGPQARHECRVLHSAPAPRHRHSGRTVYPHLRSGPRTRLDRALPRTASRRPPHTPPIRLYGTLRPDLCQKLSTDAKNLTYKPAKPCYCQTKAMSLVNLSRRERQIMDALFRLEKATAADIHAAIPDPPSYTAVRTTLRILEDKGAVVHE